MHLKIKSKNKKEIGAIINDIRNLKTNELCQRGKYKVIACYPSTSAYIKGECFELTLERQELEFKSDFYGEWVGDDK